MFRGSDLRKLGEHRRETLLAIHTQRQGFEEMVQRAEIARDAPDEAILIKVRGRFAELEKAATEQDIAIDQLDVLQDDARYQGQLEAYICPQREIAIEGRLCLDEIEEWNVPRPIIAKLRALLGPKLDQTDGDPGAARSALRALFEERDAWDEYTDDYEETMNQYTRRLFVATIAALLLAITAFQFAPAFIASLLFAGVAGSCISVMAKMPAPDVSLSGELQAYARRILSRISVGVAASLIGCALLGWSLLAVSVQGQSFSELLTACAASPAISCGGVKTLIVLAVAVLFGCSEHALLSFEQKMFGNSEAWRPPTP